MGYYDPPEFNWPICPVCGNECETYYFDNDNHICGCENCVTSSSSVEYEEERLESLKELEDERRTERMLYDD